MSGALQAVFQNQRSFGPPPGQQAFTTPGTYSWVAPAGVTKVSVVAVGPGGSGPSSMGGGGGGLGYKNSITTIPLNSYTVVVGNVHSGYSGVDSYFCSAAVVRGGAGASCGAGDRGGTYTGDGGGDGGTASSSNIPTGGGGAGGYSGKGGAGGITTGFPSSCASKGAAAAACSGGGGGGGGGANVRGGGGGGVGILGKGATGSQSAAGYAFCTCGPPQSNTENSAGGNGGSGGAAGVGATYFLNYCTGYNPKTFGTGGLYGGGMGGACCSSAGAGSGAVRIIWPGCARSFPSTRTANE